MIYKNKFKRGRYPRNWKGDLKIRIDIIAIRQRIFLSNI